MEEIKTTVEPKPKRQYRQKWREYNLAQTREKGHFETLLYELCRGIETPIQLIGRPRLKLGDVIFCLAYKTYTGLAARRLEPDLYELQRRGFVQEAPHFNTPYLYLAMLSLTPYLHALIAQSALPLRAVESDFAVDSTGFGSSQSVRWLDVRYDEERKGWSKVHLICGVKTHIVADAIASGPYEHDYTFFKPLVDHAAQSGFRMKEISADKAYLGGTNFHAALRHGAIPYIPFKSNSTETPRGIESAVWKRLFHFFHFHQEEFYSHYHKRSNVESTFSMIKAKFGASLRSKNETSRFNEALMKVLCHNICRLIHAMYELGVEPTFCEELPPSQKVSR
jgi:transposase